MLPCRVLFVVLSFCLRAKTLDYIQGDRHFHPVASANHIFNTIHSSMRQWGSSLNHNGMSLFPAIVPQGTVLHHGTSVPDAVTGMEWVAFERDHALQFAHLYLSPAPLPPVRGGNNVEEVYPDKNSLISFRNKQHILHSQRQPWNSDPVWVLPGYLHSYSASKDLRLLYLDGSAAAKTNKGTLDVSDLLLLNDSQMIASLDHDRARRLCQIAAKDWGGRIDGFVRMEAGFEIIVCSFAESLRLVEALRVEDIDDGGTVTGGTDIFHWLRAVAARYNGIGGSPPRVQLNYNAFVTAYAYSLDVFQNGSTALPRLIAAPQNILEDMRSDLKSIIFQPESFDNITHSSCNWQAVADMIVQKYANPLQYLVTSSEFNKSSTRLAQELNHMLRPFFDTLHRDATIEAKRCAAEFMPLDFHSSDSHDCTGSLSERAIYTVSYRICSTLINVLWSLDHPSSTHSGKDIEVPTQHLTSLRDLTSYLAWTEWKKCKGCSWNEICSIPMFPFGVARDHERPRCRSVENLGESTAYWDDTQSESD